MSTKKYITFFIEMLQTVCISAVITSLLPLWLGLIGDGVWLAFIAAMFAAATILEVVKK